jgi:hypothetical protein
VIHAYLGYYIVSNQEQLTGIALLIQKMSGNRTSVTDSTHYIIKESLCLKINDVDHISEGLLSSLGRQIRPHICIS